MFDEEIRAARDLIAASGEDPSGFTFEREDIPPDDEGNSMFTMRYDVTVHRGVNSLRYTGGIGLAWVDDFAADLHKGRFGAG